MMANLFKLYYEMNTNWVTTTKYMMFQFNSIQFMNYKEPNNFKA